MCKLITRFAVVAAVAGGSLAFLYHTKAGSYVRSWASRGGDEIDKMIPLEEKLARIKNEVKLLDTDIEKAKGGLALAISDYKDSQRDIDKLRGLVGRSASDGRSHGELLDKASKGDKVDWPSHGKIDYDRAVRLFADESDKHKALKDELRDKETTLADRLERKGKAEAILQELRQKQTEMTREVEEAEKDLLALQQEQNRSAAQNDGSRLADIKSSLKDLRKEIDVRRVRLSVDEQYAGKGTEKVEKAEKSVGELKAVFAD